MHPLGLLKMGRDINMIDCFLFRSVRKVYVTDVGGKKCVRAYVCMYVCASVCVRVCVCVCVCVSARARAGANVFIMCLRTSCVCARAHTHILARVSVHTSYPCHSLISHIRLIVLFSPREALRQVSRTIVIQTHATNRS